MWLRELSNKKFREMLLFADDKKYMNRLSSESLLILHKEFERRKMLNPDMLGGICVKVSSLILLRKSQEYFIFRKREDRNYFITLDDLKGFFNSVEDKVTRKLPFRPRKRKKTIDREIEQTDLLEFLKETDEEIIEINDFIKTLTKIEFTEVRKRFNQSQLNLLLDRIADELNQNKIKLKNIKNIEGVSYLDDCTLIKRVK